MVFFGLFGNKEKKNTEINNSNKAQILNILQNAQMASKDPDTTTLIRNIVTELQSQGETSAQEVVAVDAQIIQLVKEAHAYILKGQYPTAMMKLSQANAKTIDRHQYCFGGGMMTKADKKAAEVAKKATQGATVTKTRAEELQEKINEAQTQLAVYEKEFEDLRKLHTANPNNRAVLAQATTIKNQMDSLKTQINNYTIELNNEVTSTLIDEQAKLNETLAEGRTYTETQTEVNIAKLQAQNAEMQATAAKTQQNSTILGAGAVGDPFAENGVFGDPFAETATTATSNPFGTTTASPAQQTQFGAFDAGQVGSAQLTGDIRRAMQELQRSIDMYNEKIEDENDNLTDYNNELRPLLIKRKTASPSDCIALDGQIDQINAKRSAVVYKIKRYRQCMSEYIDKLNMLEKLSTQNDIASTNAKIEQMTGGKFSDFEGLAMYLKDAVRESNERLEEIGVSVSVAESEDIMLNSTSGANAVLTDAYNTKDETKYSGLEQELGLMA